MEVACTIVVDLILIIKADKCVCVYACCKDVYPKYCILVIILCSGISSLNKFFAPTFMTEVTSEYSYRRAVVVGWLILFYL